MQKKTKTKWAIELRNGSFFQDLESDNGGPMKTAMTFESKEAAEAYMGENQWIYWNGGMALEIPASPSGG